MHHTALRMSIEWARVEPERYHIKNSELQHYKKVITSMKQYGLEPFVTLHHITNPQWFANLGGWTNPKSVDYFATYVERVTEALGDQVKYWFTINEPNIWNAKAYLSGSVPPFHKGRILAYLKAQRSMAYAHKRAYEIIHAARPDAVVGLAWNMSYLEPASLLLPVNKLLVKLLNYERNFHFLDSIAEYQDMLGVNYYTYHKIGILRAKSQKNKEVSDVGWEIFPKGIYYVVKAMSKRYQVPIIISENGVSDATDKLRASFIKRHIQWVHKAIEEGANVQGYLYWSLLDNFEWRQGFKSRFGLVAVDFSTFQRTPRHSASVYGMICKANAV